MRLMGLVGLVTAAKVLAVVIFGGFLVLVAVNAVVGIGLAAFVFLVGLFFAILGVYTFYQHYFGTP